MPQDLLLLEMPVWMSADATQLTCMPSSAHSAARLCVSWFSLPFTTEYTASAGYTTIPVIEETLTTAAPPAAPTSNACASLLWIACFGAKKMNRARNYRAMEEEARKRRICTTKSMHNFMRMWRFFPKCVNIWSMYYKLLESNFFSPY